MAWTRKQDLPGQIDLEDAIKARRPRGRKRAKKTAAVLSLPPSTNNLYWNVAGKGRVKTDDYRAWLEAAGWELKAQKAGQIKGHVGVQFHAGLMRRRRDLDNLLKPTLDALVMWGIIEDDSWVADIHARWDRDIPEGHIAVYVRQIVSPAVRPDRALKQKIADTLRARMN